MFYPTHNLIAKNSGKKTPVCLTPASKAGYFWIHTALDSLEDEPLLEYHSLRGIVCRGIPLINFSLEPIQTPSEFEQKCPVDALLFAAQGA